MQEPPQRRDAFLGLFAQLLADLTLIGELAHAEELARQRVVIERLAVRETAAARARRVDQLADDDLRARKGPAVFVGEQRPWPHRFASADSVRPPSPRFS